MVLRAELDPDLTNTSRVSGMGHVDRAMRRALEERAKRIRLQGQLQGWPRDRIVEEILHLLPQISPLEAHRLATGWTRLQLSQALDALYEADGLLPPHVSVSEICRWEHGTHQPTPERQEYLTRLYQTRPDRLGFGRDHSPRGPAPGDPGPPRLEPAPGRGPMGLEGPLGIGVGRGDRIVSVGWVPEEEGRAGVVEVEDGDQDGRTVLRLVGWGTPPADMPSDRQAPSSDP